MTSATSVLSALALRTERLDHVAHRQEVPQAPFKDRVAEAAVGQVCKGNAEAAQNLAGGKETALGIAEAGTVGLGPLIQGTPQEDGDVELFSQPGAFIFGAEVAMGQEQAVDLFLFELLRNLVHVLIIIEKTFLVDIGDIYKVDAQLLQALGRQTSVFDSVGRAENAAPGGRKAQFDGCHSALPPVAWLR